MRNKFKMQKAKLKINEKMGQLFSLINLVSFSIICLSFIFLFNLFFISPVYGVDFSCPGGQWVTIEDIRPSSCHGVGTICRYVYGVITETRGKYKYTDTWVCVHTIPPYDCRYTDCLTNPHTTMPTCDSSVIPTIAQCNHSIIQEWQCPAVCTNGQTRSCYSGHAETENNGECKAGTQTCVNGQWGACTGEVLPQAEICGDGKDNNCNGLVDEGCEKILSYVSGNGQEDFICKTLQNPFVVSVSGASQDTVGIGWQITNIPSGAAGASIANQVITTTGSDITSSAYLKLGSLPGSYTAEAICSECTSGSPQVFTATATCPEVPRYSQGDYKDPYDKWCKYTYVDSKTKKSVTMKRTCDYDSEGKLLQGYTEFSISDIGCALTSTAIVMKWYKYQSDGKSINPVSLNGLMNDTENGYINGGFNFDKIEEVTKPQLLLTYKKDADKKSNKPLDKSYMDRIDEYLKKCIPVIVRVYNSTTRNTHFVVVAEKIGDDYVINDPGYKVKPRTRLSDPAYGGNIYGIRVYENKKGACEQ